MVRRLVLAVIILLTVMMIFMLAGCSEKNVANVVVERSFGTAAPEGYYSVPTSTPSPSPEATAEPETEITLKEGAEAIAYVTADEVNVREQNGTNGEILGTLEAGSIVSVIKKDYGNGWSKIYYNDAEAFVATQYLSVITTEKAIVPECTATVNAADVNMRTSGSTEASIICSIPKNTQVDVIKKDSGHSWSMIIHDNKVGFVASRYLDFSDEAEMQ